MNYTFSRQSYLVIMVAVGVFDRMLASLSQTVETNAYSLLAAGVGALIIRFAWPRMPVRQSVGGWLVGVLLACLFGNDAYRSHLFGAARSVEATWGIIALIGDVLIQIAGWVIRLAQPIGRRSVEYTEQHPGEAFDEGLKRIEQVTSFWTRIKTPLLDLFKTIFH
ncbi:hypothetical protein [Fibrella aestuarina]|nr:hypothetical protein [Fibrella aestuarina]